MAYGLNRYGYHAEARELTERIVRLVSEKGVNERYNGVTGDPLGVPGLGMSCSIWSMVVQNIYGVQEDFRTVRVPPEAKGRRLLLGKLEVRYPKKGEVELRSGFERRFRVVFPEAGGVVKATVHCEGRELSAGEVTLEGQDVLFTAREGRMYRISLAP